MLPPHRHDPEADVVVAPLRLEADPERRPAEHPVVGPKRARPLQGQA